ncbi:MAG: hypothetical protein AAGC95_05110 [Pseudomonadota bacterium]
MGLVKTAYAFAAALSIFFLFQALVPEDRAAVYFADVHTLYVMIGFLFAAPLIMGWRSWLSGQKLEADNGSEMREGAHLLSRSDTICLIVATVALACSAFSAHFASMLVVQGEYADFSYPSAHSLIAALIAAFALTRPSPAERVADRLEILWRQARHISIDEWPDRKGRGILWFGGWRFIRLWIAIAVFDLLSSAALIQLSAS